MSYNEDLHGKTIGEESEDLTVEHSGDGSQDLTNENYEEGSANLIEERSEGEECCNISEENVGEKCSSDLTEENVPGCLDIPVYRFSAKTAGLVARNTGVDAIVLKCWRDVLLSSIGVFGSMEPGGSISVHLRIFSNGRLIHQQRDEHCKGELANMRLEPPVVLECYRRYLLVARVRGNRVWVGCQATVLHSPVANTKLQLAWYTPELELLEMALDDDEEEESVEEIFVNRTSTQRGQFPYVNIRMP